MFDVNKTVVMMDSVANKSVEDVANAVLANITWGTVVEVPAAAEIATGNASTAEEERQLGKAWRWDGRPPTGERPKTPGENLMTYEEFWQNHLPGVKDKKRRQAIVHRFTYDGEPGERLQACAQDFLRALELPEEVAFSPEAQAVGLNGAHVFVIPAFYEMMVELKRKGRSFSIVFRTYGEDLPEVCHEFNAFCEGRHPLYPGACFDGRDGRADYRVDFAKPQAFGTLYRGLEPDSDAIIFGTFEQPELGEGLEFYEDPERFPSIDVRAGGIVAVHRAMRSCTMRPGTLALRDHWSVWKQQGMGTDPSKPNYGKLMTIDSNDAAHCIFFDDNITHNNSRIVDVRHVRLPQLVLGILWLLQCHLVPAEAHAAVTDKRYFLKHIERLSAAYERRCQLLQRLQAVAWRLRNLCAKGPPVIVAPTERSGHDPWLKAREFRSHHSTVSSFDEEDPPPMRNTRRTILDRLRGRPTGGGRASERQR